MITDTEREAAFRAVKSFSRPGMLYEISDDKAKEIADAVIEALKKASKTAATVDEPCTISTERVAIANQARQYASHYPDASDGRNTFILLAEWIEARIPATHSPPSPSVSEAVVEAACEAYNDCEPADAANKYHAKAMRAALAAAISSAPKSEALNAFITIADLFDDPSWLPTDEIGVYAADGNDYRQIGDLLSQLTVEHFRKLRAAALTVPAQELFQHRVNDWMQACFGPEISADKIERNHRFIEEALELVQSLGAMASECHQIVDYVFGREVGQAVQETGGVMVTLAALCLANSINMAQAGETELTRVWTKIEKIRAKQAAKPKHSPLPQAVVPAQEWRPTYRHKKRGTTYRVIGFAEVQAATGPLTEAEICVVYQAEDQTIWVRRKSEFFDGRFEPLPAPPAEGGK